MEEHKTFLQGLPKAKREALLRGSGGALKPRDGRAAAKKPVAASFMPQEFARLVVRSQSLEGENASLRAALEQLSLKNRQLEGELQGVVHAAQRRQQRDTQDAALRCAELDEQVARQKAALSDLARTAEGFARENADLKAQVEQLADAQEDSGRAQGALQERLSQLQSTCLALSAARGGGPSSTSTAALLPGPSAAGAGGDASGGNSGSGFLEAVSATLMVLSKEQPAPPVQPSVAKARAGGLPTDLRLALRELEGLQREREGLRAKAKRQAAQLDKLQAERRELLQSRAAERRGANVAAEQLQAQLEAAKRRSEYLAAQVQEKNAQLGEKDSYIHKLEQSLLFPARQPGVRSRPAAAAATSDACGPAAHPPPFTPVSLAALGAAAAASGRGSPEAGRPGSPPACNRCTSPEGWCSYHLGSPGGSTRCGSASLRHPCSAHPGSERDGGGSPWWGRPDWEQQMQRGEQEQAVGQWSLSLAERPCRQAAPNNPLFTLDEREGEEAGSPAQHAVYRLPAGADSPSWVQASPACLATSLTFLHQNSLFACSPSPAGRGAVRSAGALLGRPNLLPAGGAGAQRGLLSPDDAQPSRPASRATRRSLGPSLRRGASPPRAQGARPLMAQQQVMPPQRALTRAAPARAAAPAVAPAAQPGTGLEGLEGELELPVDGFSCVADLLNALTPRAAAASEAAGVEEGAAVLQAVREQHSGQAPAAAKSPVANGQQHGGLPAAARPLRQSNSNLTTGCVSGAAAAGDPAARPAPDVRDNRHTLHRSGSVNGTAGGNELQALKAGRLNRAADQMAAAPTARPVSYAAAARQRAAGGAVGKFTPCRGRGS